MRELITVNRNGMYCEVGDFYIDPWRPVDRAIITHGHADHARAGHSHSLTASPGVPVLKSRLGDIVVEGLAYGERLVHNGVTISLHPAGHVLGSAQVRVEYQGEVWVASGDYKTGPDSTCAPFEPVRCDTFITESTFGLPVYRWQPQSDIFAAINEWWRHNQAEQRTSVLFCYSFGKAQRILAGIDASIGPVICHGSSQALNQIYREAGVALPPTLDVRDVSSKEPIRQSLVIAPPSAAGTPWIKRFGDYSDAFASGWMLIRGARRRRSVDRGFILSDHADWPGLMQAIAASEAGRIIVTHGQIEPMVRWLDQNGLQAGAFKTHYGDEDAGSTDVDAVDSVAAEADTSHA